MDTIGIAAAIVGAAVVIIWIFYGVKHVFRYPLQDSGLDIRILGVTVRHVPFSDIDRVEVIPFAALVPFSGSFRWHAFYSWGLCGFRKRVVLITRRTGFVKQIIVSPRDPEAFANSLRVASTGISPGG
jgi:hypothetical protein